MEALVNGMVDFVMMCGFVGIFGAMMCAWVCGCEWIVKHTCGEKKFSEYIDKLFGEETLND